MSRPTLDPAVSAQVSCTGLSPSPAGFPKTIPLPLQNHVRGPNPSMHAHWFGRFSSPGSLPYVMDWRMDTWSLSRWVSPFRDLRIIGYLLLPEAFRSLSRLSSALGAKASALCSFLLGLSDAIALTSDGLLVFFYHCSRSASFSSLSYVKRIIKK